MHTDKQPPDFVNPAYNKAQSERERFWKSAFPRPLVLILSIIQLIFTVLIFFLEIASLAVLINVPTGVGIWSAIAFLPASLLTFILGK
jgi:hypothetical protein